MKRYATLIACLLGLGICSGCGPSIEPDTDAQVPSSGEPAETDVNDLKDQEPDESAASDTEPDVQDAGQEAISPDQIGKALQELNPGFDGNVTIRPITPELFFLGVQARAIKDISPLKGQRIAVLDLSDCDIDDISPLEGLPIVELYLERNERLSNLAPLRNMPLQKLYLSNTKVENLGPLRGAPLTDLNLLGTRVKDLSPLTESPTIKMLWLTDAPVKDIKPLGQVPLVSLTLENCPVDDLSPLAGHPLQRLHIAGTHVTDLSPLGQTQLSRLIFTPRRIQKGMDVIRQMPTLRELGTQFNDAGDDRGPPNVFWEKYDKDAEEDVEEVAEEVAEEDAEKEP